MTVPRNSHMQVRGIHKITVMHPIKQTQIYFMQIHSIKFLQFFPGLKKRRKLMFSKRVRAIKDT